MHFIITEAEALRFKQFLAHSGCWMEITSTSTLKKQKVKEVYFIFSYIS